MIRGKALQHARAELAAARRIVAEAEGSSMLVRAEAARYAEARRREADYQAAQIVRDAEHRAATLASTDEDGVADVLAEIATYESRLRDLVEHLRAVAASLGGVSRDEGGSTTPGGAAEAQAPPQAIPDKKPLDLGRSALG